jgi:hypothetical protein
MLTCRSRQTISRRAAALAQFGVSGAKRARCGGDQQEQNGGEGRQQNDIHASGIEPYVVFWKKLAATSGAFRAADAELSQGRGTP